MKLGKKRRESSKRNYYFISPRVIIKAILIIISFPLGFCSCVSLSLLSISLFLSKGLFPSPLLPLFPLSPYLCPPTFYPVLFTIRVTFSPSLVLFLFVILCFSIFVFCSSVFSVCIFSLFVFVSMLCFLLYSPCSALKLISEAPSAALSPSTIHR